MQRVAIIASASGCGKTTLGRKLARILDVQFVELDAIHHQAGWRELSAGEFRREVEPIVEGERWVIDGVYRGKLGHLVLDAADTVVWLDLPRRIWLPRLLRRTMRRVIGREELWNGNRETIRNVVFSRDSLVLYALRHDRDRQDRYPRELAGLRVARLRSQHEVDAFVRSVSDVSRARASAATAARRPTPLPAARARSA